MPNAGRAVAYESAGTVEFVYDDATGRFYFLEVNTRLQVEHGVTEEVTGFDLVEWMVRQAVGVLDLSQWARKASGSSSIQVRLYSEDPGKQFQPSTGPLTELVCLVMLGWRRGSRAAASSAHFMTR